MSYTLSDGTRVRETKAASMRRQVECPCLCHDVSGGPVHRNERCACKADRKVAGQ